jgi:hypothetical protein
LPGQHVVDPVPLYLDSIRDLQGRLAPSLSSLLALLRLGPVGSEGLRPQKGLALPLATQRFITISHLLELTSRCRSATALVGSRNPMLLHFSGPSTLGWWGPQELLNCPLFYNFSGFCQILRVQNGHRGFPHMG